MGRKNNSQRRPQARKHASMHKDPTVMVRNRLAVQRVHSASVQ
jgi:hypothetical protein